MKKTKQNKKTSVAQQVGAIDDYTSHDDWNMKGSFEFVQVN